MGRRVGEGRGVLVGVSTGVDLKQLSEAGVALAAALGRELPGRYHRYHLGRRPAARRARSA